MKKILSVVLILVMCAALALTTGCNNTGDTDDKKTSSVTVENIYGSSELTQEQIAAFQNSGEITLYTTEPELAKGEFDDEDKEYHDWLKKYYGLTIKYKFQAYGDDLTKFMVDYAADKAPDYISLNYRRWPKAGTRQIVYTVRELEEKGIVGLDHPQMKQYADLQAPFCIGGECYSPIAYFCNPVVVAVNTDLYKKFQVKSPVEYYKEGNWNMDTFLKCCEEITRTLPDGTKYWGAAGWNYSWYLVANDARLITWDDNDNLVLTMTDKATVDTLEMWQDMNVNGYSPSAQDGAAINPFGTGLQGMKLYTADNHAQELPDVNFNWDIVPMPYGDNNTSGLVPGEISGSGIVTSSKNVQGIINYLIANRVWNDAERGEKSLYLPDTYEGVYNDEQIALIQSYCDKVDQDIYMGVGNINSHHWKFWDDIRAGMDIKTAIETYEPVWQVQVDEENANFAKAKAEKNK